MLALTHDKILGPISPAGRIHPLVVGDDFRVGENGPTADIVDPNPFRFFPPNPIKRMFQTPRTMLQGIQYYLGFVLRYVLQRSDAVGRPLDREAVAQLEALRTTAGETVDVTRVLDVLGPPRTWIKRPASQVMVYGAGVRDELSISLGLPPGVGNLLPIPGIGELLRFDYSHVTLDRSRTLLFFSPENQLLGVVQPTLEEEDVEDAE